MKKRLLLALLPLTLSGFFSIGTFAVTAVPALAADTPATTTVTLTNPLGTTDPRIIIGNVIRAGLSIIGSITLVMFIYGGVLWITSMGNDKQIAKGKAVLVWTVIGLAVIAGAYTLTNAVINSLTTGSATGA